MLTILNIKNVAHEHKLFKPTLIQPIFFGFNEAIKCLTSLGVGKATYVKKVRIKVGKCLNKKQGK